MFQVGNRTYPKLPKVTWQKDMNLGYVYLYPPDMVQQLRRRTDEIRLPFGRLIIDFGPNDEILGIESLAMSHHFPKWVLEQAEIFDKE